MKNLNELTQDIDYFMKNLKQPLLSEIQLEVLLAMHLKQTGKYEVYPEYTFPTSVFEPSYPFGERNDKISIDLVVCKGEEYFPIELKYKTKKETLGLKVFGGGTKINLAEQSAKNLACYGFWKDVKRIELIKEKFQYVKGGAVLFVTNAKTYKNKPEKGSQYAPFSTYHDREINKDKPPIKLDWDRPNIKRDERRERYPPFVISNFYKLEWKDIDTKKQKLHYLILSV